MSDPRAVPSLDELASDPSTAHTLDADAVRSVLLRCAAVLTAVATIRPSSPAPVICAAQPPDDRLLPVPEAAQFLGFASSYVYELIRRGEFPAVRRGKYVRIRRSALVQWVAEKESA
jgi:excisionase family DNA binding protein